MLYMTTKLKFLVLVLEVNNISLKNLLSIKYYRVTNMEDNKTSADQWHQQYMTYAILHKNLPLQGRV